MGGIVAILHVRLLGGLAVSWGKEPLPPIAGAMPRSLFAYLLTYRDRPHTRDLLAGTFWPDLPDNVARRRLTQALWQIRRALSPHPVLLTEGDTVQVNPDLPLWLDVQEFGELVDWEIGKSGQPSTNLPALEQAVNLYQGEFLAGYYDDWALVEQERLHEGFLDTLERLVAEYKSRGDYRAALTYARRLAGEDPWREEAHREVMRLCHVLGRDAEALKQYDICRQILADELGVEPSPETKDLAVEVAERANLQEPAWAPAAARPSLAPLLDHPDRLPLVGRQSVLAEMLKQVEDAAQGAGGLILVYGEAGVGKTRLLRELARNTEWRGSRTTWGRCYELGGRHPYQPLLEVLRADLPLLGETSLEPLWRAELARLLPELATGESPPPLPPEQEQRRLLEAITRGLLGLARATPGLILLEDAHWIDLDSLGAIHYLLPRLEKVPLLIVVTARSEELAARQAADLSALERTRLPRRLELGRLNLAESGELVQHALGLEAPPPRFTARLFAETEGNPFFLIETLRALVDEGLLYRDESGEWSTPWDESTEDYAEMPLPDSVTRSIKRRLERLAPLQSEMLGLAAIIGRGVDYDLWHLVSDQKKRELLDIADQLCRKGLLLAADARVDGADYLFAHDQIRRVAYGQLAAPRRRLYHQRVADALERLAPHEPAALAYHWTEAGVWDKAANYHRQAGDRARAVYANAKAMDHYDRALEALDHLPGSVDPELTYKLQLAREGIHDLQGEREAQAQDLAMLARLAKQSGDDHWQAQVALRQAQHTDRIGDYPAAIAAARIAVHFGRRAQDPEIEAEGQIRWGQALTRLGSYDAAQAHLEQALKLIHGAETSQPSLIPQHMLETECLRSLGAAFWCLGEYNAARRYYEQCLQLCHESGYRRGESLVLSKLGVIHAEQGDYRAAQSCLRSAVQICRDIGHRFGEVNAVNNAAIVSLYLGDHDSARAGLEQSLRIGREIGHRRAESVVSTYLALLFHRLGDNETARECGERALLVAGELGDRPVCSDALTNLGHALAGLGRLTDAAEAYGRALELRRELGEHNRAMESLSGLASVSLARGETAVARLHVEEILDHLESKSLDGADEPFRVYLTCHRVLQATDDPRAQQLLAAAYDLLQQRASMIGDEQLQQSFLENIPQHRAIAVAFRRQHFAQFAVRLPRTDAPTGRPLRDDEYVAVHWTLRAPEDESIDDGPARRQARLRRLIQQAADQGAAPTIGDLATALGVSEPTVRRDLAALRRAGHHVQTRGRRGG